MSKRTSYIGWNEYFMKIAEISALRSKDPNTQVGACVVNNNMILGMGYNGMPRGCSDDEFPWTKPEKYLYVCHAEMNAMLNSNNLNMVRGSKIFTTLFPCNECTKLMLQLGITEVIYLEDKYPDTPEHKASCRMLDAAGIKYWKFESIKISKKVVIQVVDGSEPKILAKPDDVEVEFVFTSFMQNE